MVRVEVLKQVLKHCMERSSIARRGELWRGEVKYGKG